MHVPEHWPARVAFGDAIYLYEGGRERLDGKYNAGREPVEVVEADPSTERGAVSADPAEVTVAERLSLVRVELKIARARVEQAQRALNAALNAANAQIGERDARIEQLEAALREIGEHKGGDSYANGLIDTARDALGMENLR